MVYSKYSLTLPLKLKTLNLITSDTVEAVHMLNFLIFIIIAVFLIFLVLGCITSVTVYSFKCVRVCVDEIS